MKCETNFNDLFDRWQAAEEVDAETLQLIKDTVGLLLISAIIRLLLPHRFSLARLSNS